MHEWLCVYIVATLWVILGAIKNHFDAKWNLESRKHNERMEHLNDKISLNLDERDEISRARQHNLDAYARRIMPRHRNKKWTN